MDETEIIERLGRRIGKTLREAMTDEDQGYLGEAIQGYRHVIRMDNTIYDILWKSYEDRSKRFGRLYLADQMEELVRDMLDIGSQIQTLQLKLEKQK